MEPRDQSLEAESHGLVGESPPMRRLARSIHEAAPTGTSVLIQGESGTGKELIARALHQKSPRRGGPFVAVHCGGFPEGLLESELFGHEKGAFTGALVQKKGKFERAHGGTLFLDEVGELTPPMQVKLLRALQEREIDRVGGHHPIRIDIRLVSATNRDLSSEVAEGRFRQDLYYRLKVLAIQTTPLRERPQDVPLTANRLLERHAAELGRPVRTISGDAMWTLQNYAWPGNVRELGNAIEHAVVLTRSGEIQPESLPSEIVEGVRGIDQKDLPTYREALREAKRHIFKNALARAGGDGPTAARLLGLHPKTIYRHLRSLDLAHLLRRASIVGS